MRHRSQSPATAATAAFVTAFGLLVCTAGVAHAQVRTSDIELGALWGFNFSDGAVEDERLGGMVTVPFWDRLEANAALTRLYDFIDAPDPLDVSAWEAYMTVRARPFGRGTFLSVGYGLTVGRVSVRERITDQSQSRTEWTDVGVIGLQLPRGRVRPFGEMYFVDLLDREAAVGGHALFGVSVRAF